MSATLSELQFYNTVTGGNATNVVQGRVQYINSILGTNFQAVDAAEKAYWEYLKVNPPTPITGEDVVISDGDTLTLDNGGTVDVTVVDGVATYTYTAPEE